MSYNTKEKQIKHYYEQRKRKLQYQKRYDRTHKKQKAQYDKKRRKQKDYNKIKRTQQYSRRIHFPILIKKYGKCQNCGGNKKLEIHHKKYDTKNIKDCKLICYKCHKEYHKKYHIS